MRDQPVGKFINPLFLGVRGFKYRTGMAMTNPKVISGKPTNTAQKRECQYCVALRITQSRNFWQTLVCNHQPMGNSRYIRKSLLRHFRPRLFPPLQVVIWQVYGALNDIEMRVVMRSLGRDMAGEAYFQAVVKGTVFKAHLEVHHGGRFGQTDNNR